MKERFFCLRIVLISLFFPATFIVQAQEPSTYGKNAFAVNLTSLAVREVNLSYEHFLTSRRSIEFGGGIIYANDFLADQVKDWENAVIFAEHGYAARFHYKIFKRNEGTSKWYDYIAPGVQFKNVYYNDRPIYSEIKPDFLNYDSVMTHDTVAFYTVNDTVYYNENFLQKRTRLQFGIQFLWGKVYEMSRSLAFEFYFGAMIEVTLAERTDHERYATYHSKSYEYENTSITDDNKRRNQPIPDYVDKSLYARPVIQAGVKLRLRM